MTSNFKTTVATVFAGLAVIHGAQRVNAEDAARTHIAKPLQAIALSIGDKRLSGVFSKQKGACDITVAVVDAMTDTTDVSKLEPIRVTVMVQAGTATEVVAVAGAGVQVACAADAASVSVQPVQRIAYAAPAK